MAQFTLADIPGAFNRGLQFRQDTQLRPLEIAAAQQNVANAEQNFRAGEQNLRAGEQNMQFNQTKQRALEQDTKFRSDDQKNLDFVRSALRIQSLPDDQKLQALRENRQTIISNDGDTSDTDAGIKLAEAGDFETLNQGINNIVASGERQGIIKPLGGQNRPTSSAADFATYQGLLEKAARTSNPQDVEFAQQFGMQAGFERDTPQELANIDVDTESRKVLIKQAAEESGKAFEGLIKIRKTIANMNDAVAALDAGAETGPIVSRLPSFRTASIELDNIKGSMGLDVISSVTFGALSESELAFALDVALPTDLNKEPLKAWLKRKIGAQEKLSAELRKAASFLGKPGNTIADYVNILEEDALKKEQENQRADQVGGNQQENEAQDMLNQDKEYQNLLMQRDELLRQQAETKDN
jgi:hypothetical protein